MRTNVKAGVVSALLWHRPFRLQFLASVSSMVGSALTPVALAFGVLGATGSATQLGLVLAAYSIPQVVFLVAGGVWADRLPRQRVMMVADAIRFVTQLTMGCLFLTGNTSLWAMMLLQFACGAASSLFLPAAVGLVADTAPAGMKQEANALLSLSRNVTATVGPIVAGVLVVSTGAGWALVLDGLTFGLSLLLLNRLTLPDRDHAPSQSFRLAVSEGWREVITRSWIWSTIAYCMIYNVMFSGFQVLGPASVADSGAAGAIAWGASVAGLGGGHLLGSMAALRWRPTRPLLVGRILMLGGAPVLFLLAFDAPAPVLVAASVLCGFALSFPDTLWDAALQEHVPGQVLARVSSFDYFGSFLLRPVGFAGVAILAGAIGTTTTLLICGVVMLVATLVSLLDGEVRRLTGEGPVLATSPTVDNESSQAT